MRLRPRFTLWFSLAALVPIAAAAVVTREVVSRSYTDAFARTRSAAERTLRRELGRIETGVVDVVDGMSEQHPLVHGVHTELRKAGGSLPPEVRREVKKQGEEYMRGLGLDVLLVVETGDQVLAAPHYRPAAGTVDPVPARRAQAVAGRAYYVHEPVIRKNQVTPLLVVEAARQYRDGRHRVTVVAGRAMSGARAPDAGAAEGVALLDHVRQPGRIDARIVDADGGEVVPPAGPWPGRGADTIRLPLPGPDGAPAAAIEVAVSRAELERVLARVTLSALVLAAAALLGTTLLGMFVARRMTYNLDRLVDGAHAAARGDLDHRVAVRGRDEIGAVAASFNAMMEDLKTSKERLVMAERVAAWQEIARRLAHEIKNPLTPIQMSMETLRKTWRKQHPSFAEIFEESTATVLEETARLGRIVSEFSHFARMPKPQRGPCDLGEVVTAALALYEGTFAIERHLAEGLPPIHADRDQLSQVLLNLLENARDALAEMPADHEPRIVVTTRLVPRAAGHAGHAGHAGEPGDMVELVIEDNGPGMPEHVKEKLFTPYFTTKQDKGGTGLGLAIVHRILSDHGGRIQARDAARRGGGAHRGGGGGGRFVIHLPAQNELSP